MIVEIGVAAFIGALTYVSSRMKGAAEKETAVARQQAEAARADLIVFEAEEREERERMAPSLGGLSPTDDTAGAVSKPPTLH